MRTANFFQLELDSVMEQRDVESSAEKSAGAGEATTTPRQENDGHAVERKSAVVGRGRAIPTCDKPTVGCGVEALLTFADAAAVLGISLRQFRRLVDAGKVTFVKVSERSPRVRPSELKRFLDASAIRYSEVQS